MGLFRRQATDNSLNNFQEKPVNGQANYRFKVFHEIFELYIIYDLPVTHTK